MRASRTLAACASIFLSTLIAAPTLATAATDNSVTTTTVSAAEAKLQSTKSKAKKAKAKRPNKKKPIQAANACPTGLKPLVLLLHGYGGNGESLADYSGWRAEAAKRGWELLRPTARESTDRVWDINPGSVDVKTLTSLVENYKCHDPKRVYITGHSMGAHMTSTMFCSTNLFAAAAPVAGVTITPNCPKRTAPLVAYHGYQDWLVPINGAIPPGLHAAIPPWARTNRYLAVSEYARRAGCTTQAKTPKVGQAFGLYSIDYGCKKILIVNPQGVHEWPTYATQNMAGIFANARL